MGILHIIPTPIGNLEDITYRAVERLKKADYILAEDTRTSGKLLKAYDIQTPMKSYHMHNEHKRLEEYVALLENHDICLISDAGMPGISDPGYLLIRECIKHDIEVVCLPGAAAFLPALVASGLPCDTFVFEGFLPHKKGRKTRLEKLAEEERTIVLYESPHRLVKALGQLSDHLGSDRLCSVSREISKMYEEHVRGTLEEVKAHFEEKAPKGEIVICVGGRC